MTAAFLWSAQSVAADEAAMQQYRDFLPEQLLALSEDVLNSQVPMVYLGAANDAVSPFGEVFETMALNVLMYDAIGGLEGARKTFQKDLGEKQTGQLTVWQLSELGYRASRQNMTYVGFFSFDFGGTILENQAWVGGTVEIIDERISHPVNHVEIECEKSTLTCTYRQIALSLPDRNSWSQSYHVGETVDEVYLVTRWDNDQIDAIPMDVGTCRINQLSLNFASKEFFEIAKNVGGDCTLADGTVLPKLDKPRISRIVDGQDIVSAEFSRIKEEAFGYLSSDFRSLVEEAKKQSELMGKQ
jgi:hypothetical protein